MNIALLAMPFLAPWMASIGLTQIKARLKQVFGEKLNVYVYYINHDLYAYFGHRMYKWLNAENQSTAIGEWIFRQEAFDNIEDNRQSYIEKFYAQRTDDFSAESIRKIMDLGGFIDRVIRRYHLDSCQVVGVNANFNVLPGLSFCRHLKKINKNIITVIGGSAVYMEMGEALNRYYPYLDYVCSGSGLVSFPRLIEAIINNQDEVTTTIDGIFSKNTGKNVGKLGEDLPINTPIDLDYGDFLESYHTFNINRKYKPVITLETSRGCYWNKCKFCSLNENKKRFEVKQAENALKEINHYLQKYKCMIEMVDNVMPRSYIKKVLPYIENPEKQVILYETRADYNKGEIKILSQAGVTRIQAGIESLATDVHEVMNKGVNVLQCITMLKLCVSYRVYLIWNLIVGFPGMNDSMYRQLMEIIPKLTHLVPPQALSVLRFDRYSSYWHEPGIYDLDLQPARFYRYLYPYDNEFLSNVAYFFDDSNLSSQRYRLLIEYFPQLMTLVDRWKKQWRNGKKNIYPKLYRVPRGKNIYIHDSRDSPGEEYPISPLEDNILKLLEEPMTGDSLKENFPHESPGNISAALAHLDNNRLLFKERGKVLSLVLREYNVNSFKGKPYFPNPVKHDDG
jgi:ribosomal peptide maturation radical SAM protein 1